MVWYILHVLVFNLKRSINMHDHWFISVQRIISTCTSAWIRWEIDWNKSWTLVRSRCWWLWWGGISYSWPWGPHPPGGWWQKIQWPGSPAPDTAVWPGGRSTPGQTADSGHPRHTVQNSQWCWPQPGSLQRIHISLKCSLNSSWNVRMGMKEYSW